MYRFIFGFIFVLFVSMMANAQTKPKINPPKAEANPIKSTPAYAEVLLRKTELESVLEDLLVSYTEDFPKVKETRYELSLIQRDLTKILSQTEADSTKLTLALGKLLVRRAALETDLWSLQSKYGDAHPDVKRARRRVSSFDKAIGEILP